MTLKSYVSHSPLVRTAIVAFALCPLGCGQNSGDKGAVTPKVVIDDIHSRGAASVVRDLSAGSGSQWSYVIRGIESGSPGWLEVSHLLLDATDAGRTTDLYFALSIA